MPDWTRGSIFDETPPQKRQHGSAERIGHFEMSRVPGCFEDLGPCIGKRSFERCSDFAKFCVPLTDDEQNGPGETRKQAEKRLLRSGAHPAKTVCEADRPVSKSLQPSPFEGLGPETRLARKDRKGHPFVDEDSDTLPLDAIRQRLIGQDPFATQ